MQFKTKLGLVDIPNAAVLSAAAAIRGSVRSDRAQQNDDSARLRYLSELWDPSPDDEIGKWIRVGDHNGMCRAIDHARAIDESRPVASDLRDAFAAMEDEQRREFDDYKRRCGGVPASTVRP